MSYRQSADEIGITDPSMDFRKRKMTKEVKEAGISDTIFSHCQGTMTAKSTFRT